MHDGWLPEELRSFSLLYFRPLFILWFKLNLAAWGLHASGFHLTNLFLHFLCAVLVYHLAARLTKTSNYALIVAVLFAWFPQNGHTVFWCTTSMDLLAGAFFLGATLAYHDSRAEGRADLYALSCLAFCLALLTKENAAVLPGVLLVMEYTLLRSIRPRRGLPGRLAPLAPFVARRPVPCSPRLAANTRALLSDSHHP